MIKKNQYLAEKQPLIGRGFVRKNRVPVGGNPAGSKCVCMDYLVEKIDEETKQITGFWFLFPNGHRVEFRVNDRTDEIAHYLEADYQTYMSVEQPIENIMAFLNDKS